MITVPRLLSSLAIAMVAVAGCSKGASLKTVAVTGKVTLDGQPLTGATITFVPATPPGTTTPPVSSGITSADGSYKLITMASGKDVVDGVPPGNYKVMISKQQAGTPQASTSGRLNPNDPETMKKMASMTNEERNAMRGGTPLGQAEAGGGSGGATGPKAEFPAKYSNIDTSGFTATVSSSPGQTFDFPMTSGG